jgi:hypothetical protein
MDVFKELIYPAQLTWSAWIKARATLDPSSVTHQQLLDTLLEVWEDDATEDQP